MLLYQKEVTGIINETKKTSNELWVYDLRQKSIEKSFMMDKIRNGLQRKILLPLMMKVY